MFKRKKLARSEEVGRKEEEESGGGGKEGVEGTAEDGGGTSQCRGNEELENGKAGRRNK